MSIASHPIIRQQAAIKAQHGADLICLFLLGDFYEAFGEDAQVLADICHLTLTARTLPWPINAPVAMAGFPAHTLNRYTAKLVVAGYKVAVCEQTE